MDYVDWIERVLNAMAVAVAGNHDARIAGISIWEVARRLDLGIDPMAPEFHGSDERMALIDAVNDLSQMNLAVGMTETGNYFSVKLTDEGRRGATASLRGSWPSVFTQVRIDDEMRQFLQAAVARSEFRADRFAMMRDTTAKDVFADLGWPWHPSHATALTSSLEAHSCIHAHATLGGPIDVRVTYVGVVVGTREQQTKDQKRLGELLDDWETSTVDFKRELALTSKDARLDFAHDVLTLANVQGRQPRAIVIGFDPKTRAPFKSVDPAITQDRLEDIVNGNTLGRPPEVRWRTIFWRGITAGLVEIIRDPAALPYRSKGILRERYGSDVLVRRGTHSAVADEKEVADLEVEAARARDRNR